MNELLSAQQIADQIGVHKATVNRIAAAHGIGCLVGQQRIFKKSDVRKVKQNCNFVVGNPNFRKNTKRPLLRQPN